MAVTLGIDVGTTAVKCALVDNTTRALVASAYEPTDSYVDVGIGRAEQHVDAILLALYTALDKLQLQEMTSIGICGQMHGIVWWRAVDVGRNAAALTAGQSVEHPAWSRLVTWEDQRCSEEFLSECRHRIDTAHVEHGTDGSPSSGLSSGYGLATYAHTLQTNSESLVHYDTCGTIQDLVAFLLCGHTHPEEATIDTTNACSWGAFNLTTKTWNDTTVSALGIPIEKLPRVQVPGSIIGHTTGVFGLPAQINVYVPMGDHPCSVHAAIAQQQDPYDASTQLSLVNFGTSAQLAMVLPTDQATDHYTSSSRGFEIRPFLNDHQVLGVAAALSGGNMFAWLVQRCQEWITELLDGASNLPSEEAMYERLIHLGLERIDTDLEFYPTLNGERDRPSAMGQIDALRLHNASLGDLSASLCRGLVRNLVGLVPHELHNHFRSTRVIGTGNALVRNALLQHFLARELRDGANLRLQDAADAAMGAALVPVALNLS